MVRRIGRGAGGRIASLGDVATPPLDLLLGPEATDVLAAAVAEYGCRLEALRAADVDVDPSGAAVVVTYVATLRRADGSCTTAYLGATTGTRIPAGAAVVAGEYHGETVAVGIWAWPRDPALPGLPTASDPVRLADVFRECGLSEAPTLSIRPRRYRTARQAVLEVSDGRSRWFVKVVPPPAVREIRRRHDIVCRGVPAPPVLAWTPSGLIVLPEGKGTPLLTLIADGHGPLPPPEALEAVLDALPDELMLLAPRPTHLQLVDDRADVLRYAAADEPAVLRQVADLVAALHAVEVRSQKSVPTHGDFYEGQLLAENGRVTAVLDIDTAGPGERADEWATLLAHLSVLALDVTGRATAPGYRDAVLAHAERRFPSVQLHQRTAAALLGLAITPFQVQQHQWPEHTASRLRLAKAWLLSAA